MLATVTMCPLSCLIMAGRNSPTVYQWLSRLTPKIFCSWRGVVSTMVCAEPIPALLMRMVGCPTLLRIVSAALWTAVGSVMSQVWKWMLSGDVSLVLDCACQKSCSGIPFQLTALEPLRQWLDVQDGNSDALVCQALDHQLSNSAAASSDDGKLLGPVPPRGIRRQTPAIGRHAVEEGVQGVGDSKAKQHLERGDDGGIVQW